MMRTPKVGHIQHLEVRFLHLNREHKKETFVNLSNHTGILIKLAGGRD